MATKPPTEDAVASSAPTHKTPAEHLLGTEVLVVLGAKSIALHNKVGAFLFYTDNIVVKDAKIQNVQLDGYTLEGKPTPVERAEVRGTLDKVGELSKEPIRGVLNAKPEPRQVGSNPPQIVFKASDTTEKGTFSAQVK